MEVKTYSREYYEAEKKFCVESWYETLKHFTAKSFFIKLSQKDIEAFRTYYKCIMLHKVEILKEDAQIILEIENKMEKILKDNKIKNFFVRFTMRSPKDGISYKDDNLKQVLTDVKAINDYSEKLKYIFRMQEKDLKCTSPADALNLSLTSERVFTDFYRFIEMKDNIGEVLYEQNLIIREWVDGLSSEKEYRCFVYKNKMTAISQYNHYITIPEIQNREKLSKIKGMIFKYWDTNIRKLLVDFESYVVDFAVIDEEKVFLIELNPCDTKTGTCLFNWKVDKEILLNEGLSDLENYEEKIAIRCKEDVITNIQEFVEDFFLEEMKNNFKEKKYDYYYEVYKLKKNNCMVF